MIGKATGTYQISNRMDKGSMGEVYREKRNGAREMGGFWKVRDTRLGHIMAITKVKGQYRCRSSRTQWVLRSG